MKDRFKEIETERLTLRKIILKDKKILWDQFFNDYENYKFYEFKKIKKFEMFEQKIISQTRKYNKGNYYRWAIIEKKTGNLVGSINLHNYDKDDNNIKIGYFILKDYQNRGYATESLLSIINFAFKDLNVHRITASVISDNVSSSKVLLKAGFVMEGTTRQYHKIDGKYYDNNIFGILNEQ